ncbi:non-homologous end-joining DNA ligase [Streptomyces sp. NBC_01174]|uniref:DNA ligase (ATP) n=2 Tax=Streptomyces TaxID=1883 RepID=A0A652L8I3_9ACTN|nr:putative DNA ligase-like protein [Streptomyces sp. ADI93-02]TXS31468.1 ATP-dependent DNA ligase [Streptomyces sp. gb1(2016)]
MNVLDRLPADLAARLGPAVPQVGERAAEKPMLAVLSDRRSFDERWLFERKLDGVRTLALRSGDGVRLLSRGGLSREDTYPEVVDALAAQACEDFTVDGEIVAVKGGRMDFSLLQQRSGITDPRAARAAGVTVLYYVFDLLRLDGRDTTGLPLRVRKSLLRDAITFRTPLRFTPHRNTWSDRLLPDACASGWEGLIAKRGDSPYVRRRSPDWLKLKCEAGQEFVIGGYTRPSGSRVGFGALLIGYHQQGRLRYAGKVGTGFDTRTLRDLTGRLEELSADRSPFADPVPEPTARWVRPELVAQLGFTEWTRAGRLRHPRFLGLRDDKDPADVVRETPSEGGP